MGTALQPGSMVSSAHRALTAIGLVACITQGPALEPAGVQCS
jgi:hypothetical protein